MAIIATSPTALLCHWKSNDEWSNHNTGDWIPKAWGISIYWQETCTNMFTGAGIFSCLMGSFFPAVHENISYFLVPRIMHHSECLPDYWPGLNAGRWLVHRDPSSSFLLSSASTATNLPAHSCCPSLFCKRKRNTALICSFALRHQRFKCIPYRSHSISNRQYVYHKKRAILDPKEWCVMMGMEGRYGIWEREAFQVIHSSGNKFGHSWCKCLHHLSLTYAGRISELFNFQNEQLKTREIY